MGYTVNVKFKKVYKNKKRMNRSPYPGKKSVNRLKR